jgi:hypothetical protein
LDEVFVKVNGNLCYLWRAVDHEGEVLEAVATAKRDKAAALKLLKRIIRISLVSQDPAGVERGFFWQPRKAGMEDRRLGDQSLCRPAWAGIWISGTSSTSALTPNARRSNLSPLSSTFLRRGRDRAETPGLVGWGFLHFAQGASGKPPKVSLWGMVGPSRSLVDLVTGGALERRATRIRPRPVRGTAPQGAHL